MERACDFLIEILLCNRCYVMEFRNNIILEQIEIASQRKIINLTHPTLH